MSLGYHYSLQAGQPCEGKAIEYIATAFITTQNRSAAGRQVILGKTAIDPTNVEESAQRVIAELDPRERNRLIAINYFRFCNLKPHNQLQLERVAAVAFTKTNPNRFVIRPETLKTTEGIGAARSVLPPHHLFTPIVDFATLPEEGITNSATTIVEAAVSRPGNQAYVALRGLETVFAIRRN